MVRSQKGITLVELLAALTLVSIVVAIAWTALSTGMQHTASEVTKTQLQQEANLIITKLTNEHRKNDLYYLRMNAGKIEINTCDEVSESPDNCKGFLSIVNGEYTYGGTINGVEFQNWNSSKLINPKKDHVILRVKVADPAKPTRSVTVETALTRILTDR
ncbi:prepilin-type N-terminal cleavage/methylation domain-containing protein [Planococcus sp. SIMBA_160]